MSDNVAVVTRWLRRREYRGHAGIRVWLDEIRASSFAGQPLRWLSGGGAAVDSPHRRVSCRTPPLTVRGALGELFGKLRIDSAA
jgi:hypothetical protein